jgi:hypothetical protein
VARIPFSSFPPCIPPWTRPLFSAGEEATLGSHIGLIALSVFFGYLLNLSLKYLGEDGREGGAEGGSGEWESSSSA